jgi:predicted nuclease of predicted toxin-antitoxin system
LFDEHVNAQALRQLQARGVDVIHVGDAGLLATDDAVVFDWARREGRIVITRNYQDFAPLVTEAGRQRLTFPGVLFLAQSLSQSDIGGHVRSLEGWIVAAREMGRNPVANTFGWLLKERP